MANDKKAGSCKCKSMVLANICHRVLFIAFSVEESQELKSWHQPMYSCTVCFILKRPFFSLLWENVEPSFKMLGLGLLVRFGASIDLLKLY